MSATRAAPKLDTTAPTPADYQAADRLRGALQAFLRSSDRVTRKHGLTTERYNLLLFIKTACETSEGATVKGLGARLHLAQSSVTQLVRRAEDLGLVQRELSPRDARVRYLQLTKEGQSRLAGALAELTSERAQLTQILTQQTAHPKRPPG